MQTNKEYIFACGNVVHVNDLVDNVTEESLRTGRAAAQYAAGTLPKCDKEIPTVPAGNVRYICPQRLVPNADARLFFRAAAPAKNVTLNVYAGENKIYTKKLIRINPGEMESVDVKAEAMAGVDSVRVEVI